MSSPDILIVDDDPDMVETLELVLCADGYSCRTASNGAEALDMAAAKRPGLVLLDMLMPVMNGWDCAHELRQRYGRTVPIVVVTASEHAGKRAAEADADDVLPKPFDIDELRRIVARHLDHKRDRATG